MRGLIGEFGIVLPLKVERLRREITPHLNTLPGWARRCADDLLAYASLLDTRINECDEAIRQVAPEDSRARP